MISENRLSTGTKIKLFLCAGVVVLSACKRAEEAPASFSITIPTAKQLAGASQSMQSALDFELLCFAIDVQGGSIKPKEAETCQPVKGHMFGSAKPGEVISGEVNTGTYTFKVYALKRDSTSQACPKVTADSWNWPLSKVYFAGEASNQSISEGKSDVTIQIQVPDSSNNLIAENSYPAACSAIGLPPTGTSGTASARILSGALMATGSGGNKLYSKIHFKPVSQDMQASSGKKIKNWKAGSL